MAFSEKGIQTVQKWIADFGAREAAKKIIDNVLIRKCGMSSSDLADTAIFMNGLDEMEGMLTSGDFEGALIIAKETAEEMLEDEGYGDMDESKKTKKTMNTKQITLKELKSLVKKIIKEEMVLKEGEQWIDGYWEADNYQVLIKQIELIFSKGGNGASFSYNGKDFTITRNGERFQITSDTDWGFEALTIKSAIFAAHSFSNGV